MSSLMDVWIIVRKKLEEMEQRAIEELVVADDFNSVLRIQEKIKVIKTLYTTEFSIKE